MKQRDVTLLTSAELKQILDSCNGVIIPIASMEQCGLHGATGIDVRVAQHVAPILAESCDLLYAPVIPYGDALEMQDYPGTVNVPTDVLGQLYYSVALSYLKSGAKYVLFLASHSLNTRAADYACRRLYSEGHKALIADFWKACSQKSGPVLSDPKYGTGHGAEQITSVSLAVEAGLIRLEKAANELPKTDFSTRVGHIYGGSSAVTSYSNFHDYCDSGSWGDVSGASAEKGAEIVRRAVENITESVMEIIGA